MTEKTLPSTEVVRLLDEEFLRGAEALYHHLQHTIIGYSKTDAISIEILKFLRPLRKKGEKQ